MKTNNITLIILCIVFLVVFFFVFFPLRNGGNTYQPPETPSAGPAISASPIPQETKNYPENTLGKMQQLYDTQQYSKAKEFCLNVLATNPDEMVQWNDIISGQKFSYKVGPTALETLAQINLYEKNFNEALGYYQEMVDKYPHDELLLMSKEFICSGSAGAEGLAGMIRVYFKERPDYQKAYQLAKRLRQEYRGESIGCEVGEGYFYQDMAVEYISEYLTKIKASVIQWENEYRRMINEATTNNEKGELLWDLGLTLIGDGYKERVIAKDGNKDRAIAILEEVTVKYPEAWARSDINGPTFFGLQAYIKLIEIYQNAPGSSEKLKKTKQGMKELYYKILSKPKDTDYMPESLKAREEQFTKYFQ